MDNIKALSKKNRQILLKHINNIAIREGATILDCDQLNLMLEAGRSIPDVILYIKTRGVELNEKVNLEEIKKSDQAHSNTKINIETQMLITPLEKYYFDYVA